MQKILVLCSNYEPSQFPKKPDETNRFYTYGFGSGFGKLFKNHLAGYEIEIWRIDSYCEQNYYEKNIDGLKFRVFKSFHVPKLGHFSLRFIKSLRNEYKKSNPLLFIVHTHNWQTYQILFFLKHAKIITTHHGEWSPFFNYKHNSGLRKLRALLGIIAEKLVLKNVNHFLIGDLKQVDYIKKAAPDFKYTLFSSGLEIDTLKPIRKEEARKLIGWSDNKKYILYVGKLYKYKQVDELIRIWKDIKKIRPETELVLVGNEPRGTWGEEYYDFAAESGANIIGRVLNTELYKYFCAADVFVLISLREDYFGGTGIAPIESLACNTPVVSNSMRNYLGDCPEKIAVVPETLEEYKEAILNILEGKITFQNTRAEVEKYYSHEAVVKRIENVFKQVLQK